MDMLEVIKAMVTGRSLGEIKLNTKETATVTFSIGATIDETRFIADTIKKRFVLKTEAERAVPNPSCTRLSPSSPTLWTPRSRFRSRRTRMTCTRPR